MASELRSSKYQKAIAESWDRCKHDFSLVQEAMYPVMRLQSTEVTPRLEAMVDKIGGRRGIFQRLADIAGHAGHCLVLCDADQVVVRLEARDKGHSRFERHGIALGSCWNERIAGTNGVAMAMTLGETVTVRGNEHFFSKLNSFSCTSVPLLDACNRMIGAVSLSTMDSGNAAECIFSQQLLEQASRRVQNLLFEQHYKDALIVTVSSPTGTGLSASDTLIALDDSGCILGATRGAGLFPGEGRLEVLTGTSMDTIAGLSIEDLVRTPGQVHDVHLDSGDVLNISVREQVACSSFSTVSGSGPKRRKQRDFGRRRLSRSLRNLAIGSRAMADSLEQVQVCFANRIPLLIEGESGTGKTRLVTSLHADLGNSPTQLVRMDCTVFDESVMDRLQTGTFMNKVSTVAEQADINRLSVTLLVENVADLPASGQARLRNLLETLESMEHDASARHSALPMNVVATTDHDLLAEVDAGRFREDLYYLLCGAHFVLPALRNREGVDTLASAIATTLAGNTVELTNDARVAIRHHDWPGNVRELRNTLRQSLIAGNGERISLCDITLRSHSVNSDESAAEGASRPALVSSPCDEKTAIMDALDSTHWNVSRAARKLGIGRATIHRKMLRHGIVRPDKER
ncbi:sigma-54-dependent Fis family transcriptional regulator [Granulosicoccus sp. 3-233]|uniref:sigma-54-dependent Fis family transcriptional regulator n=1 Tax=Granulosicoccus sp. 3-233 TaxID=3417969 RepID=UPI003D33D0D2